MRLFVAIDPPEDVRRRLGALSRGLDGARWVPLDQVHLTLRFLGEVGSEASERIASSLEAVREPRFSLTLAGVGRFPPARPKPLRRGEGPSRRAPRILWAGIEEQPRLTALHDAIEARVREAGLPPEDKLFSPHLTLARLREGTPSDAVELWLERGRAFREGPFAVDRFSLYSSVLAPTGAQHRKERSYELA